MGKNVAIHSFDGKPGSDALVFADYQGFLGRRGPVVGLRGLRRLRGGYAHVLVRTPGRRGAARPNRQARAEPLRASFRTGRRGLQRLALCRRLAPSSLSPAAPIGFARGLASRLGGRRRGWARARDGGEVADSRRELHGRPRRSIVVADWGRVPGRARLVRFGERLGYGNPPQRVGFGRDSGSVSRCPRRRGQRGANPTRARPACRQLGRLAPGAFDHRRGFERRCCLGHPFAGRRQSGLTRQLCADGFLLGEFRGYARVGNSLLRRGQLGRRSLRGRGRIE